MAARRVLVVGGGLGGLALAQSLKRAGVLVTVFERDVSPTGREQGYHIGLNPDGAAALRECAGSPELEEVLAAEGGHINSFAMVDAQLRPLIDIRGVGPIVDRIRLRHTLTLGLQDHIQWNKRFRSYEELPSGQVRLHFEDGSQADGDVVVGADGARSALRQQRCPSLLYDNVNAVNIIGELLTPPATEIPHLRQVMERNMVRLLSREGRSVLLFGFRRADGVERMWWTITMLRPAAHEPQIPKGEGEIKTYALQVLANFHPEMRRVVELTPRVEDAVELNCVQPMKTNPLGPSTRVTLLGDAAHAMTTHRGLGANTAFQDAAELSRALQAPDLLPALAAYEAGMIKRGFQNVEESRRSTGMITMGGWSAAVRDNGMWVVSGILAVKRRIFG